MAIKLRTVVKHPGRIEGDTGISVEKENGVVTVALDLTDLADTDTIADQSVTSLVLVTPGVTDADPDLVQRITVDNLLGELTAVATDRQIIAGQGLTGGGNLSADRTLNVGAGTGVSVFADAVALDETHVSNVDHTAVTLTAGAGLTGGGDISASRSFSVGAGAGIAVNADDVALAPIGAYSVLLNNSGSSAAPSGLKISALADRTSFGPGDKLMIEESSGELRKIDYADLAGAGAVATKLDFATRIVAMASSIPGAVLYVRIAGYSTIGDGGTATYKRVGSEPSHAGKFQSADGAWWELTGSVIAPECFGAKGDLLDGFSNVSTATDNTQSFKDLAAYINAVGGGVIVNFRKANYKIWPSGSIPSTIFALSGAKGVTINGNGALLYTNVARAGLVNVQVFLVINSIGFEANDLGYHQTDTSLDDPSHGASFFYLQGGTESVRIRDAVQNGGLQFIACARAGDPTLNFARVRDIEFSGRITNVYYGLSCMMSGDQVRGYLRSINSGRSAIIYNCRQVDLTIESNHGGPFDDIEIAAYGHPGLQIYETHTSDIKINYYMPYRQQGTDGTGSVCRVAFAQLTSTPAPAFIRNLDLQFHVTVATNQNASLVQMTKSTQSGNDSTPRGHQLHNVKIGGYVTGYTTNNIMQLFTVAGSMAGDSVRNIIIRDLVCEACTTDINVNAAGFTNVILENIVAPGCDINVTNAAAGVIKTVGFGQSENLIW